MWQNPWLDPRNGGFQPIQAMLSIASSRRRAAGPASPFSPARTICSRVRSPAGAADGACPAPAVMEVDTAALA